MANNIHCELKKTRDGLFNYSVKNRNGEIIFQSEDYSSKHAAITSFEVLVEALSNDNYEESFEFNSYRKPYVSIETSYNIIRSKPFESYSDAKISFLNLKANISQMRNNADNIDSDGISGRDDRVSSVVDFVVKISEIKRDKGYSYYFRGHSDFGYDLSPGIYRKESRWIKREHRLFREIIIKCPSEFKDSKTTFQKLVKMQHYALPTRLLDITTNALIALYFSCVGMNEKEKDGEVIVFKISDQDVKYFDDKDVSLLSNLSKVEYLFNLHYRTQEDENSYRDIIVNDAQEQPDKTLRESILSEIRESIKSSNARAKESERLLLDAVNRDGCFIPYGISGKDLNKVICVKPEMDNPRIVRQDGAFLLFGMNYEKRMPATIPEHYIHTPVSGRIIIKSEAKEKIISELESLGITAGNVYPEIEHVANHIKRRYQ
ncbi:FRG domain-containing protein [Serratia nevei]|nr:FRG domain-containing protein [Serratia nevei]MDM3549853.1 FRG domain-containing protein [Serratia nevei]